MTQQGMAFHPKQAATADAPSKTLAKRTNKTQAFNLRFVWPPTCVDLLGLAMTLVELEFVRKSTQVFHRLATQLKSTQVYGFLQLAWTCESVCQGFKSHLGEQLSHTYKSSLLPFQIRSNSSWHARQSVLGYLQVSWMVQQPIQPVFVD